MLTRNKKLKDYGIPAEDIEKLNTMLKDFPAEYEYLLSGAALSACPKNTVIADMVIENILHRKSYGILEIALVLTRKSLLIVLTNSTQLLT